MMTRRAERLAALAKIASVLSRRALAPVAVAQAHRDAQGARIATLAARRAALSSDGADPFIAAQLGRQVAHLRAQQATAMADLARLQAALDLAKAAAQPAVAREHVLARLAARAAIRD